MNTQKKESLSPEKLAQDLATFAIDRRKADSFVKDSNRDS